MATLPIDIENHTSHELVVEYEWTNMESSYVLTSPDARLVIRVTQLDECSDAVKAPPK